MPNRAALAASSGPEHPTASKCAAATLSPGGATPGAATPRTSETHSSYYGAYRDVAEKQDPSEDRQEKPNDAKKPFHMRFRLLRAVAVRTAFF